MNKRKVSQETKELVREMDELEENIQLAIDELIYESDNSESFVKQHVNLIVTHLAKAAADLRIKKQFEKSKCL